MQRMKRLAVAGALTLAAAAALPGVAHAGHNADVHSNNMSLIANFDDGGTYREGSDLAFWGNRAILGNYGNPGGFRVMDISNPASPRELGQAACEGPQNDVSIWGDLVFLSVDSPRTGPECAATSAAAPQQASGAMWEGIRIFSIANPANPVPIKTVQTDCGSHTHTLVPDEPRGRVLIYVLSYPLGAPIPSCNVGSHRKISVIEVPLSNPGAARVISTPSVNPAIGCHDVTILVPRKLAGAACISESQMWDISDPANPRVLSHIANPAINIQHSTTFSWDGKTLVIGDELGGAEASPGCGPGGDHVPFGALWFYDVSNPSSPTPRGAWRIPQTVASALCTAHNFNTIPLRSGRYVLASAWYDGGTTVTDFSDPTAPVQIGHYQARQGVQGTSWSSYWYNDRYYANNYENQTASRSRGFDVFSLNDGRVSDTIHLPRLNPQTQEPLPGIGLTRSPPRSRCRDRIRPRSSFNRRSLRRSRRGIRLTGRASDRGCGRRGRGRVSHVIVAIARRYGKRTYRCSYLRKLPGRARADRLMLGRRRSCRRKTWIVAGGTTKWRYRIKARLPRGLYNIRTRAVDSAANFERRRVGTGRGKRKRSRVNVLWFRVR